MKIKDITAFCLFGLFLCSCNREELPESAVNQETVLHAGLVSVQTKTWLDSEGSQDNPVKKVYWSDGDRINVNGQASTPVSVPENTKVSDADFHLRSVDGPYNVIYPHDIVMDEAYDSEGNITISLSTSQTYHPTSFSSGAAVMYGYSENEEVALHNLCAAIRVNMVGSAGVSSALLVSESSGAPICGTFKLCPQTGQLTAVEGGVSISLDFEEVTLSPEGTDFYFAIPAGNYSEGLSFYFTNASDGRKMQCAWKPESALEAGRLYSFNEVKYSPETKDIESAEEWEEFVLAVGGEGDLGKYLYKNGTVRLGADIEGDLSSITVDFPYVFDGAGHTITRNNATNALFSKVTGEVKSLTMEGVVTLSDEGAALVDVLAGDGKVTDCTNNMTVSFEAADHAYVGGLVKLMQGGVIAGCVNNGSVSVKIDISSADKNVAVGGIVAQVNATEKDINLINCQNTAELIVAPVSAAENTTGMKVSALGGVAGWLRAGKSFILDNCDNSGKIHFSSEYITSAKGTKAYAISVGGIVGYGAPMSTSDGVINNPLNVDGFDLTLSGCDNSGAVYNYATTYAGSSDTNLKNFTGGVLGSILGMADKYAKINSCTSTGDIITYDFAGEGTSTRPGFCCVAGGLAGFGGWVDIDKSTVNCTIGTGKRAMVSIAGVIGFTLRPFALRNSDIFYTGYFRSHKGYASNRAVVAVVPVEYDGKAMKMVPEVAGSVIKDCRIGALLNTADTYPGASSTDELKTPLQIFNTPEDTEANLVCGQGYTSAATDVTISGFTYWNGL